MPQEPKKTDAKAATAEVKRYFEQTHGGYQVLDFRVHSVSGAEYGRWKIVCSFVPRYNEPRIKYTAEVDATTGHIESVSQDEAAT